MPLPAGLAGNITEEMNRAGASKLLPSSESKSREAVEREVDRVYNEWMAEQWAKHLSRSSDDAQIVFDGSRTDTPTMGYVTKDLCPGIGDDIEHIPGQFYAPHG